MAYCHSCHKSRPLLLGRSGWRRDPTLSIETWLCPECVERQLRCSVCSRPLPRDIKEEAVGGFLEPGAGICERWEYDWVGSSWYCADHAEVGRVLRMYKALAAYVRSSRTPGAVLQRVGFFDAKDPSFLPCGGMAFEVSDQHSLRMGIRATEIAHERPDTEADRLGDIFGIG